MAQKSKRGRIFIYLALILILVVVLAVWVVQGGLPIGKASTTTISTSPTAVQEQMVDIVITTQSVTRGTAFTADVLTTIKYPKKDFVSGTFYSSITDVVGKLAKVDLDAQVPLTKSLVVDSGSITAQVIPAGMVAISIPLANRISSVSYAPQAGDHVNIIAAMTFVDLNTDTQSALPNDVGSVTAPSAAGDVAGAGLTAKVTTNSTNTQGSTVMDSTLNQPLYVYPSESQRPRLVSQTLLQDVIVLGVGNFPVSSSSSSTKAQTASATPTPSASSSTTTNTTTTSSVTTYPDTITVIVSPQDAVTLNYLIYSGAQLTLVLRSSGDSQRVQTDAVTLKYLMQQYNIPLPDKLAYGTDPRIDESTPVTPLQLNSRYNIP